MLALTSFGFVAMSLAAIGLYGVLGYYVARRMHEIRVRVALGATRGDVAQLVLRRGLTLVGLGLAVGVVGAFGVTRLIQQQLFGVQPTDATTFVAASIVLAAIGLIACLVPAWRAVRVHPMVALQAE